MSTKEHVIAKLEQALAQARANEPVDCVVILCGENSTWLGGTGPFAYSLGIMDLVMHGIRNNAFKSTDAPSGGNFIGMRFN